MNKLVPIATVLILLAALSAVMLNSTSKQTANSSDVKVATFAVCEEQENQSSCHDKIFASCNGTPIEVNETEFYCNGKKYEITNASLGETAQPENWTDDRGKNLITAWASSD